MTERTCLDCKWARWEMTKHSPPKINHRQAGHCFCPPANWTVIVPATVRANDGFSDPTLLKPPYGNALWAREPYTDCPTWMAGGIEEERDG